MCKLLSVERPRARRMHWCDVCRQGIMPGERHVKNNNVQDGRAYSLRFHEVCDKLFEGMFDDQPYSQCVDPTDVMDGMTRAEKAAHLRKVHAGRLESRRLLTKTPATV